MADNILINAPSVPGGPTVATDEIGGIQHELVKVEFGTDGTATMVDAANPLPVTDSVAEAALTSIAAEDFATQTTLLAILNKLLASIAVTGSLGIDQTTPGTTNGVQINNTVTTSEAAPTTVFNGKTVVTTAGTRVVLATSTTVKSVTIKALASNAGLIYVGNSTVSSSIGFQLSAGDTISLDISNLNTVNIDSANSGEGVSYLGIN